MSANRFGHSKPRLAWGEQSESDNVLMKIEGLEQKLPVFDDLLRKLIEQHAAAKEDITDLRLEYDSKKEELRTQGAAQRDIERKLAEAEEMIDSLRMDKKLLENEVEQTKIDVLKKEIIMEEMTEEIAILREDKELLEEEVKQKKIDILKGETTMKEMMEEKKKNLDEIANLRSRLRQVMDCKQTDNNPAIPDLSDRNRPSKLGEKYSELYDKEWEGAYEEINKRCDEKETIKTLLDILMYVNRKCQEYWKEYTTNLERTLTADSEIELPDFVIKQYKDVSKNVASELIEHFYEKIANGAYQYTSGKVIRDRRCENYVKGCVTICWMMATQDPPVILDTEDRFSDTDFDTDLFRPYTQTGDKLDYVVWPPLYQHHKGPLLCKGVAQAIKREPTRSTKYKVLQGSKKDFAKPLPLTDKRKKDMDTQCQTGARRSSANINITDIDRESPDSDTGRQASYKDRPTSQTMDRKSEKELTHGQTSLSDTSQMGQSPAPFAVRHLEKFVGRQSQYQGFDQLGASFNNRSNDSEPAFARSKSVSSDDRNTGQVTRRQSHLGIGSGKIDTAEVYRRKTRPSSAGTYEQMSYGHQTTDRNQQQTTAHEQHSQLNTFQATFNQNQQNQNTMTNRPRSTHIPIAGGPIPWPHDRQPTPQEIKTFKRYTRQGVPEQTIRSLMGDYSYDLCRDYEIYLSQ